MIAKEKLKAIELFTRNRITLEFMGVDLPSNSVMCISPLVYRVSKQKWDPLTICFNDEIKENLSLKLMKLINSDNPAHIGLKLIKLDSTGKEKEIFEIEGSLDEINLGGFSYNASPNLIGLEYDVVNEIEITLNVLKVMVVK